MARRKKGGGGGNLTAMMDIMTAAIGCLVLVLISCLMLVLITNVSIYFGDPNNMSVGSGAGGDEWGMTRYVQDTFGDLVPFPQGNRALSPDYIDVHPDRLVFYPGREVMSIYDLREPGNAFDRQLDKFRKNSAYAEEAYIILLIRPYTATIANELRRQIKQAGISMGFELFPEDKEVDFRSQEEWEAQQAAEAAAAEAEAETAPQEP